MHEGANADVAVEIDRDAWAKLALYCAAAPPKGWQ